MINSAFFKTRECLLKGEIIAKMSGASIGQPCVRRFPSRDYFLSGGAPIEIWASMKSSKPGKVRSNRRQRKRQETESGFSQREALERHAESGRTTNGSYASHYECSQPV